MPCKCIPQIEAAKKEILEGDINSLKNIASFLDEQDTALSDAFAQLGDGIAEHATKCCENYQNNVLIPKVYDGYPRQYVVGYDADGNPIYETAGAVADYNASLHGRNDVMRYGIDKTKEQFDADLAEDKRRWNLLRGDDDTKNGWATTIMSVAAGVIAGVGLTKYVRFLNGLDAVQEDLRKMVDYGRSQVAALDTPVTELALKMVASADADNAKLDALLDGVLKAHGDKAWGQWEGVWKPQEDAFAGKLPQLMDTAMTLLTTAQTSLNALVPDAKAYFDANYSGGEGTFSQTALEKAACLVDALCDIQTWLNDNAKKIEAHWDAAYKAHEATLNAATTTGGTDGVTDNKKATDKLYAMGEKRDAYFDSAYSGGESALAGKVLADGVTHSGSSVADHDIEVADANTRKAYFDAHYAGGEGGLAETTLQEAIDLVAKLSDSWEWFREHSDEMHNFWRDFYKGPESTTAPVVIERGATMSDLSEEIIREIHDLAKLMEQWWHDVYQAAEQIAMPRIIETGKVASEQQEESWDFFEQRYKDLWQRWDENWYPCDKKDLKFHCDMWDNHNMLEDIKSNADLARDQADINYEAHSEHGLPCETKRLDEICAMTPYEPKYCQVEGKAVLHVRAQVDRAKRTAVQCHTKFCCGASEDVLRQMDIERAKAETAALQAAHRYEQWWYVQEENRRHRYHQDIFQVSEKWPDNVVRALDHSTTANDRIIEDIHKRIVRGYEYLSNMQTAGNTVMQAVQDAIRFSIEGVRTGQFYLTSALDAYDRAQRDAQENVNLALRAIELGHFFPDIAMRLQQLAMQTAEAAGRLGNQMVELGHFHPRLAATLMSTASTAAANGTSSGINMARTGHDHFTSATQNVSASGDKANAAVAHAINALAKGPQYAQLAANKAKMAADVGLQGWQNGNYTVQNGHFWKELELKGAGQAAAQGMDQLKLALNGLMLGQKYMGLSLDFARSELTGRANRLSDALAKATALMNVHYQGAASTGRAGTAAMEVGMGQTAMIFNSALQYLGDKSAPYYPRTAHEYGMTSGYYAASTNYSLPGPMNVPSSGGSSGAGDWGPGEIGL